ncbi:MAG: adenylosuccinate synthetase [bacterium]|nr:adenylosuccinate synthetase [bacterium]
MTTSIFTKPLKTNPLTNPHKTKRPNTISIEDVFFGDSGKGSVVAKLNEMLAINSSLFSIRYNGGANAGHETFLHGKKIVTHQLPMGVVKEKTTAIISRGMLIHPGDLVSEISQIKKTLGELPGKLIIDERTPLGLDTHRALEEALNSHSTGGRGSTGRGISPGYASLYERIVVTVKDLMDSNWKEILGHHFRLYQKLLRGFGQDFELETISVAFLEKGQTQKRPVGKEKEFIKRLGRARSKLKGYASSEVFYLLNAAWKNPKIPFTLEGAQGAGIDPYHGVYPDVTASRPISRSINDATYNVVLPEEIAVRLAVMKTTYMSSVGQRRLPTEIDQDHEKWIQETFDEKGKSTGRLRDIYPVSIPIASYLKRAAGFEYLAATHLDAAKKDKPVRVITHYTDKKTGKETPYLPYQDHLDNLVPHFVEFSGWDGEAVKKAKTPRDLPVETQHYLTFLNQTIAPVILGTTGSDLDNYISWLPS